MIRKVLERMARDYAQNAQATQADLEQQIADLEGEILQKKAQIDAARLAPKRLAEFRALSSGEPQRGVKSVLRPIGGGGRTYDLFRFPSCRAEFEIEF